MSQRKLEIAVIVMDRVEYNSGTVDMRPICYQLIVSVINFVNKNVFLEVPWNENVCSAFHKF